MSRKLKDNSNIFWQNFITRSMLLRDDVANLKYNSRRFMSVDGEEPGWLYREI